MIRVSVIIPTRNRPGPLAACLKALSISFPDDAETIVVSDGGDQDLGPVVAPFVESLRLRLLAMTHSGPAAARNRGLAAARGEIVAFTDDDCIPHPGWASSLASGVVVSPPRAVGGATMASKNANVCAETSQLVLLLLSQHDRRVSGRERLLPSNNVAFPAGPLRQLGGFDERYRTAEDREICRRWSNAGFTLARVVDAVVDHDVKLDIRTFFLKFIAYGRGAARFHGSGASPSLRESLRFHFCLPGLMLRQLRGRPAGRVCAMTALLIVWECANVVGYLAERMHTSARTRATADVKVVSELP